jgi:hypothetical protein
MKSNNVTGGFMKKILIAGSMMLLLITGVAYATDNCSGRETANDCPMSGGQMDKSMDHGSMNHEKMIDCPMNKSKAKSDSESTNDTDQSKHDHSGQNAADKTN